MKKALSILLFSFFVSISSFSQGRVVINEFMPWTLNTCGGPTAEFVELLNFGPGPVNIGCYILTDGDFSITIPPNTILQPGEFYVISGQTVIPGPCANIDSTITADLNWNTCNCTSGTIPTTGDGLFTDGGSASEQVVLLNPNLGIADAVIRTLPAEPSSSITTSTIGGQCTAQTFDLDLMSISYETIGESAGRGNSFARKLDGDCGWVKDPQQSANATNNTPSDVSDVDYDFAVTGAMDCSGNGSIEIIVNAASYANIFPINYTLGFDTDNDNVFELSDSYTTGSDSSPNSMQVNNLVAGNYRITVGSSLGCNLQSFPFTIFQCSSVLPLHLISFTAGKTGNRIDCRWKIENPEWLDQLMVEKSMNGQSFTVQQIISPGNNNTGIWIGSYAFTETTIDAPVIMRLRLKGKNGVPAFSPTIHLGGEKAMSIKTWPNPARDQLFTEIRSDMNENLIFRVFNLQNQLVLEGTQAVYRGTNIFFIPVSNLPRGGYQLQLLSKNDLASQRTRFLRL